MTTPTSRSRSWWKTSLRLVLGLVTGWIVAAILLTVLVVVVGGPDRGERMWAYGQVGIAVLVAAAVFLRLDHIDWPTRIY